MTKFRFGMLIVLNIRNVKDYQHTKLWNNLPDDVQTAKSVDTFKFGF